DGLFTGNFDSLDDGRTFAESLFDEGADIVLPVAGPVGLGTAAAAKDRGLLMIGVDQDWYLSAPEFKEVYLTSILKRVDLVGYKATEAVVNGTFEGGLLDLNLANGGVDLADYHDNAGLVSADLQAELDQVRADLIAGSLSTGWAEYLGQPPKEEAPAEEMGFVWPEAPATDGNFAGIDPTGQTVVWWHNHRGGREELLLEIVNKFNAENPYGITIDAQNQGGYNDIREKMGAGAVSGDLPDIVVGYQNDQAFYASVDLLSDMNPYVNDPHWGLSDEDKADFSPGIFMQDVHPAFDNMRLGFPPNRSMEVLYYNKTWLEELGYDPADMATISPDLFEEIACASAEGRDDGEGGYIIRFDASQVAAAALARGSTVLGADGNSYNYNTPELLDYFTQIRGMYKNGCAWISPERYHDAEFAARQAIFYIGSTSGLPFAQGSLDEAGNTDEWGIAPQPYTTDTPRQNLYGGSVMMPHSTPEKELAAWIFIKWFTSPEAQADWVKASNYFSPRYSTGDLLGDYIESNPKYADAMALLPYAEFEPQLISYSDVRNAVNDAFQEIINTDIDISEALA
ncbi:MAG: extracellular solute-binding protein, partial [Anaerolineae bacterium]